MKSQVAIGKELTNKDTFKKTWQAYFRGNEKMQASVRTQDTAYATVLLRRGGGKSLNRDRQTEAREKVHTPQEYIRRGSKNVDLPGVDTPFSYAAVRGKKKIIARRTTVTVRGKPQVRFRDKKGRFVKRI